MSSNNYELAFSVMARPQSCCSPHNCLVIDILALTVDIHRNAWELWKWGTGEWPNQEYMVTTPQASLPNEWAHYYTTSCMHGPCCISPSHTKLSQKIAVWEDYVVCYIKWRTKRPGIVFLSARLLLLNLSAYNKYAWKCVTSTQQVFSVIESHWISFIH